MNVLIIEDENLTALRLRDMLLEISPDINILAILESVEDAIAWIKSHPAPDLIFMDIHLEDDIAFNIFEQVKISSPIIFTTAFDEYMIKAFKVNSVDYLLKPISRDALSFALEKFKTLHAQFSQHKLSALMALLDRKTTEYKSRFMVTVGTKMKSIEVADIAYFFTEEKITFAVTQDGHRWPIDLSLDKLILQLDPQKFFRINRQFIVAFTSVTEVWTHFKGRYKVDLRPAPKAEIFVSGDRMVDFKDWLGR
jgi:DNA-binding LytR/AlgR family response regulator